MKKIYETRDYDMFKQLIDNREVKTRTTKKIIESINQYGYITNPILVNEKYEIIDGQNRLEALKTLGLPVEYIIEPGLTIAHCRALNINQSNWATIDWIKSYAAGGNMSYQYLLNLITAFPQTRLTVINFAVTGSVGTAGGIRGGGFECDEASYNAAVQALQWLDGVADITRRIDGNLGYLESAILWAYRDPDVDNARLKTNLGKYWSRCKPISNLDMALDEVEAIYNHRNSTKAYIKTNYLKNEENAKKGRRREADRESIKQRPQRLIAY